MLALYSLGNLTSADDDCRSLLFSASGSCTSLFRLLADSLPHGLGGDADQLDVCVKVMDSILRGRKELDRVTKGIVMKA